MLKSGIIGTGKVAHLHALALQRNPDSDFTAVLGRTPSKVKAFASDYGVEAYTDLGTFLRESGVRVCTICTPHPAHIDSAVAAAEAGVHLLIEKPLASSLEHCDAMMEAAVRGKSRIGVISQRRFFEPVLRVKEAIESGKIGDPILGMVTMLGWRDQDYYDSDAWRGTWDGEGGGVLVNQAVHQLDLLLWFMGEVDELCGMWDNLNHSGIEVEDTAVASIRFKSGALGHILVSNSFNPALFGKVSVLGSNGAMVGVQTDGGQMFIPGMAAIEEPPLNDYWTVPGEEKLLEKWREEDKERFSRINPMEHYHQLQIDEFIEAVLADRDPCVTVREGRKAVELFTAIYRSGRDGKSVKFPYQTSTERDDFDGRQKAPKAPIRN